MKKKRTKHTHHKRAHMRFAYLGIGAGVVIGLVMLLGIGSAITKAAVHDREVLGAVRESCKEAGFRLLYDNPLERFFIGYLGKPIVTEGASGILHLRAYSAFQIPVGEAIIDCAGGSSYKIPRGVGSFEQCMRAGYPVMELKTPECRAPDGRVFIEYLGTKNWKTATDSASGVRFQYPDTLEATYIEALDWPPRVRMESGPFSCVEAGTETARAGRTEPRMLNGREYCVTTIVEGAAGSIYTHYACAVPQDGEVLVFTFSTRSSQCGNYGSPHREKCERERDVFDIDTVIDRIVRTAQAG